jgi:hypothetical protein
MTKKTDTKGENGLSRFTHLTSPFFQTNPFFQPFFIFRLKKRPGRDWGCKVDLNGYEKVFQLSINYIQSN